MTLVSSLAAAYGSSEYEVYQFFSKQNLASSVLFLSDAYSGSTFKKRSFFRSLLQEVITCQMLGPTGNSCLTELEMNPVELYQFLTT